MSAVQQLNDVAQARVSMISQLDFQVANLVRVLTKLRGHRHADENAAQWDELVIEADQILRVVKAQQEQVS